MRDAATIIDELRSRLDVVTDADLARSLDIDKSTISSWRSRGRVPERYVRMLDRDGSDEYLGPPVRWTAKDRVAFDMALLRFTRALAGDLSGDDPIKVYATFALASPAFWALKDGCRRELNDVVAARPGLNIEDAYGIVWQRYVQDGDAGVERDRKALIGWLPAGAALGSVMSLWPDES